MTASGERLDELAQLEEQRRFLLRSLEDLERERAAGDIDERDYESLKADYTTRAAAIIRRIEGGAIAVAEVAAVARRRAAAPAWRRPVIALAVVAAAVGAGVLVARSAGERKAGQTITGGVTMDATQARIADLLTRAREATGTDPLSAIEAYDQVAKLDPTVAEAWTYGGWQLRIVAQQAAAAQKPQLLNGAERRLIKATEVDPTYPDPYAFLAVMALRDFNDAPGAKAYLQQLDKLNPGPQILALTAGIRTEVGLPAATSAGPTTVAPTTTKG